MHKQFNKKGQMIIMGSDQFNNKLEQEYEKQLQNQIKKTTIEERIQNITGKTRNKMKLEYLGKKEKFNKKLDDMRHLDTFIDAKDKIQKLNAFNNRQLLRQLDHYHAIKKYQSEDSNTFIGNIHQDKLFKELDMQEEDLRFIYNDPDYIKLELSNVNINNASKKYKIDIKNYITHKNLIEKVENKIKHSSQDNQLDDQQFNLVNDYINQNRIQKLGSNNEQTDLFGQSEMQQSIQKIEQNLKLKQQKEAELNEIMVRNTQRMLELAKEYGIDINEQHFFSQNSIYNQFKQRTHQLIKQIEQEAKKKFQEKEIQFQKQQKKKTSKIRISSQIVNSLLVQYFFKEKQLREKRMKHHKKDFKDVPNSERSPSPSQQSQSQVSPMASTTQGFSEFSNQMQKIRTKNKNLLNEEISEEESENENENYQKQSRTQLHFRSASQPQNKLKMPATTRGNQRKILIENQFPIKRRDGVQELDFILEQGLTSTAAIQRKKNQSYNKLIRHYHSEFERFQQVAENRLLDLNQDKDQDEECIEKMGQEYDVMVNRYELKAKLKRLGFSSKEIDDQQIYQLIKKKKQTQQQIHKQIRAQKVSKYF